MSEFILHIVLYAAFCTLGYLLGREKARSAVIRDYQDRITRVSDWAEACMRTHSETYVQGMLDTIEQLARNTWNDRNS